jgi:hypothetical protein
MSRELSPPAVAARLAELRALAVPERVEDAARRLEAERRDASRRSFAVAVERRLAELRSLCELASYLHRRHADP